MAHPQSHRNAKKNTSRSQNPLAHTDDFQTFFRRQPQHPHDRKFPFQFLKTDKGAGVQDRQTNEDSQNYHRTNHHVKASHEAPPIIKLGRPALDSRHQR